jgi:hypothetical protein
MTTMIRKQVYLEPRQDLQIKQLAEERGTTEAHIIRKAIDLLLSEAQRQQRAQAAWEEAHALMEARAQYAVSPAQAEEHAWTRDDLYAERLERYEQCSD